MNNRGNTPKTGAGRDRTAHGENGAKNGVRTGESYGELPSAGAGRNLSVFLEQLAEDGRNLFKIGRLIQEQIGSCRQTFIAIFGVRKIGADQDIKVRIIGADGAKNVESAAAGHVQVKNHRIRLGSVDSVYRGDHIARLAHEPCAWDLFEKADQAFHD